MSEEFRAIKPHELEECLDLWGKVFERVGREYFPPYFYGDPWFKPVYTRVCAVDGRLVSAVQICQRKVRVGDAELVMGGIGNVGTYSEYRGRGYSSRLMKDTVRVMREHKIDFSVLFTGIQPFYEKVGWRSVPQRVLHGRLKTGLTRPSEGRYSIRTSDWEADLPHFRAIYDAFNKGRPLTTVRTPEYWDGYLAYRFGKPEFTLVAESGGRPVGYIWLGWDRPNCWLKEIGWLPGEEACAGELIREASVRAREIGCEVLVVNLPHEPEVPAGLAEVADKIEPREPMGMMCRITGIRTLSERLLPELSRRARENAIPPGAISLDTEKGSLALTIENKSVSLGAQNPIRLNMTQLEFFCLIFGIKDAEELGLLMPAQAGDIISGLFPRQRPVFWLADHF